MTLPVVKREKDSVDVATSGKTMDRSDTCPACARWMLYYVPAERVVAMFCGNSACPRWLKEVTL